MSLLANIIGFSFVGFAARIGQLSIQKRNLYSNPGGHLLAMGVFGYVGYLAHRWETYSGELLAQRRQELRIRRQEKLSAAAGTEAED